MSDSYLEHKKIMITLFQWKLVTICFAFSVGDTTKPYRSVGLTNTDKLRIVESHNSLRNRVYSSDMRYMTWDGELAWQAESYGSKCRFRKSKVRRHSIFNSMGENLFAVAHAKSFNVSHAIHTWSKERTNFRYQARICREGTSCSNYTQMVWAQTYKVGCTLTHCQFISGIALRNALLFVCNYAPSGNLVDKDGKLKMAYQRGHACTKCGGGDYCRNKLCANAARDLILPPKDASDSSSATIYHIIIAALSALVVCLLLYILLRHFQESIRCIRLKSITNKSSLANGDDELEEPQEYDSLKNTAPLLENKIHDAENPENGKVAVPPTIETIEEEPSVTNSNAASTEKDQENGTTIERKVSSKRSSRISLPRPTHPAPRSPPPLFAAPVLDKFL